MRAFLQQVTDKLLIGCLVLMTLIQNSPAFTPIPTRDPGVFLYIGWRILNGEVPYRDVWDHKPPVIYYLNALGLALTENSRWGVWIIEFIFLFLAALIGFQLLKKHFGFYPSLISQLLWLVTLPLLFADGNFTNEYTLPLQFFALWLFHDNKKNNLSFRWFLIGLTGTVAFFTKQTSIGIWIAILIFVALENLKKRQLRELLTKFYLFSMGVTLVSSAIFALFWLQGALGDFLDAAFTYNFTYLSATKGFPERLIPLLMGIDPLTESGLFQFAMVGYGIAAAVLLAKKEVVRGWENLVILGLLDLPLEFLLANISGRAYPHYYISILPVLSMFTALTLWVILSQLSTWKISETSKSIFQLSMIVVFLWSSLFNTSYEIRALKFVPGASVVNYIETRTSPDDYVLIWGAETSINFHTLRRSPTSYVYQYPLYTGGYVNEEMILSFLDDIIQNRPRLIIDTKNGETPIFQFPIETKAIEEKITCIKSNYQVAKHIGDWIIYEYSGVDNTP